MEIAATDSMQELVDDQEPSYNIDLFYQSCRNYYIVLIDQIQDHFKFEDEILDVLALVEPRNARNLKPKSLRPLFARFPVLTENIVCKKRTKNGDLRQCPTSLSFSWRCAS